MSIQECSVQLPLGWCPILTVKSYAIDQVNNCVDVVGGLNISTCCGPAIFNVVGSGSEPLPTKCFKNGVEVTFQGEKITAYCGTTPLFTLGAILSYSITTYFAGNWWEYDPSSKPPDCSGEIGGGSPTPTPTPTPPTPPTPTPTPTPTPKCSRVYATTYRAKLNCFVYRFSIQSVTSDDLGQITSVTTSDLIQEVYGKNITSTSIVQVNEQVGEFKRVGEQVILTLSDGSTIPSPLGYFRGTAAAFPLANTGGLTIQQIFSFNWWLTCDRVFFPKSDAVSGLDELGEILQPPINPSNIKTASYQPEYIYSKTVEEYNTEISSVVVGAWQELGTIANYIYRSRELTFLSPQNTIVTVKIENEFWSLEEKFRQRITYNHENYDCEQEDEFMGCCDEVLALLNNIQTRITTLEADMDIVKTELTVSFPSTLWQMPSCNLGNPQLGTQNGYSSSGVGLQETFNKVGEVIQGLGNSIGHIKSALCEAHVIDNEIVLHKLKEEILDISFPNGSWQMPSCNLGNPQLGTQNVYDASEPGLQNTINKLASISYGLGDSIGHIKSAICDSHQALTENIDEIDIEPITNELTEISTDIDNITSCCSDLTTTSNNIISNQTNISANIGNLLNISTAIQADLTASFSATLNAIAQLNAFLTANFAAVIGAINTLFANINASLTANLDVTLSAIAQIDASLSANFTATLNAIATLQAELEIKLGDLSIDLDAFKAEAILKLNSLVQISTDIDLKIEAIQSDLQFNIPTMDWSISDCATPTNSQFYTASQNGNKIGAAISALSVGIENLGKSVDFIGNILCIQEGENTVRIRNDIEGIIEIAQTINQVSLSIQSDLQFNIPTMDWSISDCATPTNSQFYTASQNGNKIGAAISALSVGIENLGKSVDFSNTLLCVQQGEDTVRIREDITVVRNCCTELLDLVSDFIDSLNQLSANKYDWEILNCEDVTPLPPDTLQGASPPPIPEPVPTKYTFGNPTNKGLANTIASALEGIFQTAKSIVQAHDSLCKMVDVNTITEVEIDPCVLPTEEIPEPEIITTKIKNKGLAGISDALIAAIDKVEAIDRRLCPEQIKGELDLLRCLNEIPPDETEQTRPPNLLYEGVGIKGIEQQIKAVSEQIKSIHTRVCELENSCPVALPSEKFAELELETQLILTFVPVSQYPKIKGSIYEIHLPNPIDNIKWCEHIDPIRWNRGNVGGRIYWQNSRLWSGGWFATEQDARDTLEGQLRPLSTATPTHPDGKARITSHGSPKRMIAEREMRVAKAVVVRFDSNNQIIEAICIPRTDNCP